MLRLTIFLTMLLLTNTASTPNTLPVSQDCLDLSYIYSINKNLADSEEKCLLTNFKTIKEHDLSEAIAIKKEPKPKESLLKKVEKTVRAERTLDGSKFSLGFSQDSGINMDIHEDLKMALIGCPNKDATITSGRRNSGYRRSLHRCGKAVDIHYDTDFIDWLLSKDGSSWLESHNLEFFIEDRKASSKNKLPERFKHKFRWIPWATQLHIHMNLKR